MNKDIYAYFQEIISKTTNPLVFEFGAFDGQDTQNLLRLLEQSKKEFTFHTFEPINEYFKLIESNCEAYKEKFVLHQLAIGAIDKQEEVFYRSFGSHNKSAYPASSSLKKPNEIIYGFWRDIRFSESVCQVMRFDTFTKENNLENRHIDFVWADIQGAEIDLIKGGKKTFENVKYAFLELMNYEVYEGCMSSQEQLFNLLPQFELVDVFYDTMPDGSNEPFNILIKNKNIT
jgi:FkbM family methyltransferase